MMPRTNPGLPGGPQAPALEPATRLGPSALRPSINSSWAPVHVCHSQEEVLGLVAFSFLADAEKLQAITTGVFHADE